MNPVVRKALLLQEQQDAEIQRVLAALRGECEHERSLSNPDDVEDWIAEYFLDEDPGSRAFDGWATDEELAMQLTIGRNPRWSGSRTPSYWKILQRLRMENTVLARFGEPV